MLREIGELKADCLSGWVNRLQEALNAVFSNPEMSLKEFGWAGGVEVPFG